MVTIGALTVITPYLIHYRKLNRTGGAYWKKTRIGIIGALIKILEQGALALT